MSDGGWVVVITRSPEDTSLIGVFPDRLSAESFIEDAHDPDGDPACEDGCLHILTDDVDYASVAYMNIMPL